jgi:hypothetical protein
MLCMLYVVRMRIRREGVGLGMTQIEREEGIPMINIDPEAA